MPKIDLDQLASQLEPIFAGLRKEGAEFAGEVGAEISKKASGGLISLAFNALSSLGKAGWIRFKSIRARRNFERRWREALSRDAREIIIRDLLAADPKLANSLYALLVRRDFVRAVLEYAEHLPNIGLLDPTRRLSEIYVRLNISPIVGSETVYNRGSVALVEQASFIERDAVDFLRSGNHLVEGAPGSGKSTLARQLVASEAKRLIESKDLVALDQSRLPVLVSARSLELAKSDISSSLYGAVNAEMAFAGLGKLPDQFFVPYSELGHKAWLVVIDGLDEIADPPKRQRLWDAISRLHSQGGEAFKFVVFTRPNSIRVRPDQSNFQRWSMQPLTSADRSEMAYRYIENTERAKKFLSEIEVSAFADICDTPLFEAIAASVFAAGGSLPQSRLGLCEAFVSALLDKSTVANLDRRAILSLLSSIAENNKAIPLPRTHPNLTVLLPPAVPDLNAKDLLKSILQRSGVVRIEGDGIIFFHDVFRSYFLSLQLAKTRKPTAAIWRSIDPFAVGWTTVQYLCEVWGREGHDISGAVGALLAFGTGGEKAAIEVAVGSSAVDDKIVKKIVDKIFREAKEDGATIFAIDTLARFARRRSFVKDRLVYAASALDSLSRIDFAEALVSAGHLNEGVCALLEIAADEEGYEFDRIRASELLLKLDREQIAALTLRQIACEGDELQCRAEAACILYAHQQVEENRKLVTEVLSADAFEESDQIFESTIVRLLAIGEKELALPLLRVRARRPSRGSFLADLPRDQIEAAKAIAVYHDRREGVDALKSILDLENVSLRGKAEVAEAIGEVGSLEEARTTLIGLIGDGPKYDGADWFLLKVLAKYRLENEVRSVGRVVLNRALSETKRSFDLAEIVRIISPFIERSELAEEIRDKARACQSIELISCLAELGFRQEAVDQLKVWMRCRDTDLVINSALQLCQLGERVAGVRVLNRAARGQLGDIKNRLRGAQALLDAGEFEASEKAYLAILADAGVSIDDRCIAARHLEDNRDAIWEVLFSFVQDESNTVDDRIVAAKELLIISEPEWVDVECFDVIDELVALLQEGGDKSQQWRIIDALSGGGVSLAEIPGAASLARDPDILLQDRVSTLCRFVIECNDSDASGLLLEIASSCVTPYATAIEAAAGANNDAARSILLEIALDPMVPPKWRLEACKSRRGLTRAKEDVPCSADIINDHTVEIQDRLAAVAFLKQASDSQRQECLARLASVADLSSAERLSIAKAAISANAHDLAIALAIEVRADLPHSPFEMVDLATIWNGVGRDEEALVELIRVTKLPDVIIRESGGANTFIQAAELLGKIGQLSDALELLRRLVDLVDWSDVVEVLDAFVGFGDKQDADVLVSVCASRLAVAQDGSEYRYLWAWLQAYEEFLARGWIGDLNPLRSVASDPSRTKYDRIGAARVLILDSQRRGRREWSADGVQILVGMAMEQLSLDERVYFIRVLREVGLRDAAERELEKVVQGDIPAGGYLAVGKILFDFGERKRAEEWCYKYLAANGDVSRSWDRGWIEVCIGKGRVAELLAAQVFAAEKVVDRIMVARDAVESNGNKSALQLIFDVAGNSCAHPSDRLEAVDALRYLGFREFPRRVLAEVVKHSDIDNYWAGDALLNIGRKEEALGWFRKAVAECEGGYRDQIARSLAELGEAELIADLDARAAATLSY